MIEDLLLPAPDAHSAPFWAACADGELRVQRCADCRRCRFPPRPLCPACRAGEADWERLSGRGTIWSWVVVHRPVLPAYRPFLPYPVVIVELVEAATLRMVGNVVAAPSAPIDSVDPTELSIGAEVEVTFEEARADWLEQPVALPRWLLA